MDYHSNNRLSSIIIPIVYYSLLLCKMNGGILVQNSVSNQGSAPLGAGPGWCSTNLRSLGRFPKVCRGFRTGQRKPRIGTVNISQSWRLFSTVPEISWMFLKNHSHVSSLGAPNPMAKRGKKMRTPFLSTRTHRFIEAKPEAGHPKSLNPPTKPHPTDPYGAPPVRVFDLQRGCWIGQRHGRIRVLIETETNTCSS